MKAFHPLISIVAALSCLLLMANAHAADDFVWAKNFPPGSKIPLLAAVDHSGTAQTLDSLTGTKGLVLLFNRSFDWCPYCKAQLKDLVKQAPAIEALGFHVTAMTYDQVSTLKEVAEDEAVSFPLLHDEAAEHVVAYGILNTDYEPGHRAYGVPEPGILIVSPDGTILSKLSEEDYRVRPDFADLLDALKAL